MARWLVKEEPTHYAYADLARDGKAEWNGVHNALALRHLKAMRPGDEVLYYHSGDVRAVVGIAKVGGTPRPDPDDDRGSWTVVIRPVRPLRSPVTLATLKGDPTLSEFDLVRIGRLSVMPVGDGQWTRILSYEQSPGAAPQSKAAARRPSRRSATARKRGST
jgi:predicted RNA-binding protein with PUA-like domain